MDHRKEFSLLGIQVIRPMGIHGKKHRSVKGTDLFRRSFYNRLGLGGPKTPVYKILLHINDDQYAAVSAVLLASCSFHVFSSPCFLYSSAAFILRSQPGLFIRRKILKIAGQ